MTSTISRRGFLATGAATLAMSSPSLEDEVSLRAYASKRGLLFGCAVKSQDLQDKPFAQAVAREANVLVPEYELKWDALEPEPNHFDFAGADRIVAFASQNRMKMRGVPLVWYAANPPWLQAQLAANPSERILTNYVARVAGRYRGRMHSWDVVNEAIEPSEGHPDGLRVKSPWYEAFGPSYIETAFHAARAADPSALLFYNEYDIETTSSLHLRRREALLRLCERLRVNRVPIDAVGIQGHLKAFRETFDEKIFARFLADIRSLGLKVMVTELDIVDIGGPPDIAKRDAEVASSTRRFMDVLLDCPATLVCSLGLSDRYSWLSDPVWGKEYNWPDGQLVRGLPLDADLQRKPMWHAIANAFAS